MPNLRRIVSISFLTFFALMQTPKLRASAYDAHPKLVVLVVIDQFPGDSLESYRTGFTGRGFLLFLDHGAYFEDCYYDYANTETAPGQAALGTGAYSSGNGIASDSWWDLSRNKQHPVTSVEDERYHLIGLPANSPPAPGASPLNLRASTLGDSLRLATQGQAKVFGISLRDRAAILAAGYSANGAFWVDPASGSFITSSYYMTALPDWAVAFNSSGRAGQALQEAGGAGTANFLQNVGRSPAANSYELDFARALISGEQLGKNSVTDMLVISLSGSDLSGHQSGFDSPQEEQTGEIDDLDQQLDSFFTWLDKNIPGGLANVWIALSADHGISPVAGQAAILGLPAAEIDVKKLTANLNEAMNNKFSPGENIPYMLSQQTLPYLALNEPSFEVAGINEQEAEQAVQRALPAAFASLAPPAGATLAPPAAAAAPSQENEPSGSATAPAPASGASGSAPASPPGKAPVPAGGEAPAPAPEKPPASKTGPSAAAPAGGAAQKGPSQTTQKAPATATQPPSQQTQNQTAAPASSQGKETAGGAKGPETAGALAAGKAGAPTAGQAPPSAPQKAKPPAAGEAPSPGAKAGTPAAPPSEAAEKEAGQAAQKAPAAAPQNPTRQAPSAAQNQAPGAAPNQEKQTPGSAAAPETAGAPVQPPAPPPPVRFQPIPTLVRSYTRQQLASGELPPTDWGRLLAHSYSPNGGWYVMAIPAAFQAAALSQGTTNFSPWSYDRHVPLAFYGAPFTPGIYHGRVQPVDMAATLASLLGINQPSASIGEVLTQAIHRVPATPAARTPRRRREHEPARTTTASPRAGSSQTEKKAPAPAPAKKEPAPR